MEFDSSAIPILGLRSWWSAIGVFGAAYLLGTPPTRRLSFSGFVDATLIRIAAGLSILPVVVLMLGQAPSAVFRFPWALPALAGIALWIFHFLRARKEGASSAPRQPVAPSPNRIEPGQGAPPESPITKLLGAVGWLAVAFTLLLLLGPAFSPPLNYDTLEYHLGVIPHYFETGAITPIPHVFYSAQPLATEMLYTLSAVLEGSPWAQGPKVLQWGLVVLAALLITRLFIAVGTPKSIVPWLALVFLSHPIIVKLELDCLTDLTGVVFMLAGLLVVFSDPCRDESQPPPKSAALLIGLLAGGAISTKWTNAGTSALILTVVAFVSMIRMPRRRPLAQVGGAPEGETPRQPEPPSKVLMNSAALYLLGVASIMVPWMAWLGWRAGNPIAPFGAGLFPTENWSPVRLEFLLQTHGPLSPLSGEYWRNLIGRLRSPTLGPELLLASTAVWVFIVFVERRRSALGRKSVDAPTSRGDLVRAGTMVGALLTGAAIAALLWGRLQFAADRFLAPVVTAELIVLGISLAALGRRTTATATSLWIGLLALGAFLFWLTLYYRTTGIPFPPRAAGRINHEEFLRGGLGDTVDLLTAANELGPESRTLAIGEARRYYFKHPITLASVFDRNPIADFVTEDSTPDSIRRALAEAGYTHLLVNEFEMARLLDFHPPLRLLSDPAFVRLRTNKDYGGLAAEFWGHAEFGPEPLSETRRENYGEFLRAMRTKASFLRSGRDPYPAFWIAPLEEPRPGRSFQP